jgi:hypothetical protein
MRSIRHHVFILIGLILIAVIVGLAAAFWVAVGLILAIGANNLTHVIALVGEQEYGRAESTLRCVLIFTILSFVLAVISAIVIFFWHGWIPAIGLVVLFIGYFGLREDRFEKAKRKTQELRQRLEGEVVKAATNQITSQQMEERCSLILEQSLPDEAYRLSLVYEPLVAQNDLGGDKYQAYLGMLERHLSKVEKKRILYSELHLKVRSLLGMPSHP